MIDYPSSTNQVLNSLKDIRLAYVQDVEKISEIADWLRAAGYTDKQVAIHAYKLRKKILSNYRKLTPQPILQFIYARNHQKYQNDFGATIEYLKAQGKTWEEIIASASRVCLEDINQILGIVVDENKHLICKDFINVKVNTWR